MSLKAIKELAAWVKARHGGAAEALADGAWAEIAKLEKACRTLGVNGVLAVLKERNQLTRQERGAVAVLKAIAKEAK